MTSFQKLEDIENAIIELKKRGKKGNEKYIHCSDHIEFIYELTDGTMEQDDDYQ